MVHPCNHINQTNQTNARSLHHTPALTRREAGSEAFSALRGLGLPVVRPANTR